MRPNDDRKTLDNQILSLPASSMRDEAFWSLFLKQYQFRSFFVLVFF